MYHITLIILKFLRHAVSIKIESKADILVLLLLLFNNCKK